MEIAADKAIWGVFHSSVFKRSVLLFFEKEKVGWLFSSGCKRLTAVNDNHRALFLSWDVYKIWGTSTRPVNNSAWEYPVTACTQKQQTLIFILFYFCFKFNIRSAIWDSWVFSPHSCEGCELRQVNYLQLCDCKLNTLSVRCWKGNMEAVLPLGLFQNLWYQKSACATDCQLPWLLIKCCPLEENPHGGTLSSHWAGKVLFLWLFFFRYTLQQQLIKPEAMSSHNKVYQRLYK